MTHEHTTDYIDRYHFKRIFDARHDPPHTFANGYVYTTAARRKCARDAIKRMKVYRDKH